MFEDNKKKTDYSYVLVNIFLNPSIFCNSAQCDTETSGFSSRQEAHTQSVGVGTLAQAQQTFSHRLVHGRRLINICVKVSKVNALVYYSNCKFTSEFPATRP